MTRRPLLLLAGLFLVVSAALGDILADGFRSPPDSARPQVWWHWVNGNVTPEGITADLTAMKRVGLGGGTIANIPFAEDGPAVFGSEPWRAAMVHAASEAQRLGLEIGMFNCEGWSSSGGPWVKPDDAMQMLVWNQRRVAGPANVAAPVQPYTRLNTYRDIATLAFPTPADEQQPDLRALKPKADVDLAAALDDNPTTFVSLPKANPPTLTLEFAQPFAAGRVVVVPGPEWVKGHFELSASDDGANYRQVLACDMPYQFMETGTNWCVNNAFTATKAKFFRFTFLDGGDTMQIAELGLYPPTSAAVDPASVVDLTGKAEWAAPAGDWTIARFGYTPIGKHNHPSTPHGVGLEIDKLSRTALEHHFRDGLAPLFAQMKPYLGSSMRYCLIDSYECGEQNWTAAMPAAFEKARGYSLTPWLLTLTGRTVGDAAQSERFNEDFRHTIAELWDTNYYAAFTELCHRYGLKSTAEAYGNGHFDNLTAGGLSDMPMSEFWFRNLNDGGCSKMAASSAHTYGRPLVAAESFTSGADFDFTPQGMKAQGDMMFADGVNRYYFHSGAGQRYVEHEGPGTVWPNGIHFNRNCTWYEQSKGWLSYIARCQYLLQAGRPFADIITYQGVDGASFTGDARIVRNVPAGYDWDGLDTNLLRNDLDVDDSAFVLKSGAEYSLLVLPNTDAIDLVDLQKIDHLVRSGGAVFGPKPTRAFGLHKSAQADAEVKKLADELWGDIDGKAKIRHDTARGSVYWTGDPQKLQPALDALKLTPDCIAPEGADSPLRWIHRHNNEADWYFVANCDEHRYAAPVTFRQPELQPQLWQPETGQMMPAPSWHNAPNGNVVVDMTFEAAQSWFVVFPHKTGGAPKHFNSVRVEWPKEAHTIKVSKAIYESTDGTPGTLDLTTKVATILESGSTIPHVDNAFAGSDPTPFHTKRLHIDYTLDGVAQSVDFPENARVRLTPGEPGDLHPTYDVETVNGQPQVTAWINGQYHLTRSDGQTVDRNVVVPFARQLNQPWVVHFDPKWGGPQQPVTFYRLADWRDDERPGIRYYSGTAVYTTVLDVPEKWVKSPLCLDLSDVGDLAEVSVNGRALGIVWKSPWRVNLTGVVKAGRNALEVRVTNQWQNRLIGDSRLPVEQRFAKTLVNPYNKDSALEPSGLIGPATLRCGIVLR